MKIDGAPLEIDKFYTFAQLCLKLMEGSSWQSPVFGDNSIIDKYRMPPCLKKMLYDQFILSLIPYYVNSGH